jgi:hypothetical protein
MIGALIIAVILVFALPVAFLMSGAIATAVTAWLLHRRAEVTHEGSELLQTNY